LNNRAVIVALVIANVVLFLICAGRELQHREEKFLWDYEAPPWARYAGTMQAEAHAEHGTFRFLRLTTVTNGPGECADTGERENGIEIWSWSYYPSMGEASRACNQAYVDGYNARMKTAIADATTQPG
jgi:hypothetical protein